MSATRSHVVFSSRLGMGRAIARSRAGRTARCGTGPDRGTGAWSGCDPARAAVQDECRLAVRIAALLDENLVTSPNLEPLLTIGLDRGIEPSRSLADTSRSSCAAERARCCPHALYVDARARQDGVSRAAQGRFFKRSSLISRS